MTKPILPNVPYSEDSDTQIRRRWPPDQFPALYLPPAEYFALLARQQRAREFLELLGPDIADIALEVLEASHD